MRTAFPGTPGSAPIHFISQTPCEVVFLGGRVRRCTQRPTTLDGYVSPPLFFGSSASWERPRGEKRMSAKWFHLEIVFMGSGCSRNSWNWTTHLEGRGFPAMTSFCSRSDYRPAGRCQTTRRRLVNNVFSTLPVSLPLRMYRILVYFCIYNSLDYIIQWTIKVHVYMPVKPISKKRRLTPAQMSSPAPRSSSWSLRPHRGSTWFQSTAAYKLTPTSLPTQSSFGRIPGCSACRSWGPVIF